MKYWFTPKPFKLIPILLLAITVIACRPVASTSQAAKTSSENKVITLFIGPNKIDCEGGSEQKCLQAKRIGETEFSPFHNRIEGFRHREGTEYTLLVKEEPALSSASEHPVLRHSLIKILKPVNNPNAKTLTLENNSWRLRSFINPANNLIPVPKNFKASLELVDSKLSGSGGCNQFFGSYHTKDSSQLELKIAGSTMMACPGAAMTLEKAYLSALGKTKTFKIFENQLELLGPNQTIIAAFIAESQYALVGPTWKLLSYSNGSALVSNQTTKRITVHFDSQGRASGFSGCNRYFMAYETKDNTLDFGSSVTTRKMCNTPSGVMITEGNYFQILDKVLTYSIQGNRLTFLGVKGSRLAVFKTGR